MAAHDHVGLGFVSPSYAWYGGPCGGVHCTTCGDSGHTAEEHAARKRIVSVWRGNAGLCETASCAPYISTGRVSPEVIRRTTIVKQEAQSQIAEFGQRVVHAHTLMRMNAVPALTAPASAPMVTTIGQVIPDVRGSASPAATRPTHSSKKAEYVEGLLSHTSVHELD